jgi:hypothetical protein
MSAACLSDSSVRAILLRCLAHSTECTQRFASFHQPISTRIGWQMALQKEVGLHPSTRIGALGHMSSLMWLMGINGPRAPLLLSHCSMKLRQKLLFVFTKPYNTGISCSFTSTSTSVLNPNLVVRIWQSLCSCGARSPDW